MFSFVNNQYLRTLLYIGTVMKKTICLPCCCLNVVHLPSTWVELLWDMFYLMKECPARQNKVQWKAMKVLWLARCWRFTSYLCFCFFEPTEPLSISGNNKYSHSSSTEDRILVFSGIAKIFMVIYRCLTISVAINGIATVIRSVFILSQSRNN